MIAPALKGTTSLLNSVLTHGSSVKRIVYTSTVGAIVTFFSDPKVYDETCWNDTAVRECKEKGRDTIGLYKYCTSKVLAERAAWDIFEKHKASGSWDLVVINPSYVFGPILQSVSGPESLNDSMQDWYEHVFATPTLPTLERYVLIQYFQGMSITHIMSVTASLGSTSAI